jgi:23S rRNA pseudouridine2605 synthase
LRLQKYLAHAGVASRRNAETLIAEGRVRVNGRVVAKLGSSVVPEDRVELDGRRVEIPALSRYIVLNKPEKVMTTMRDPERRRTVAHLLPAKAGRVVPVGRLDYDTSGVLLMTDDGDLAHVLTHPRYGVEKTYRAVVRGRLSPKDVEKFAAGVRLEEGAAQPAKVRVVRSTVALTELDLTIHEGRNRQVRRMLESLGHPVVSLTRLRFGPITVGGLKPGAWREATPKELAALRVIEQHAREERG